MILFHNDPLEKTSSLEVSKVKQWLIGQVIFESTLKILHFMHPLSFKASLYNHFLWHFRISVLVVPFENSLQKENLKPAERARKFNDSNDFLYYRISRRVFGFVCDNFSDKIHDFHWTLIKKIGEKPP